MKEENTIIQIIEYSIICKKVIGLNLMDIGREMNDKSKGIKNSFSGNENLYILDDNLKDVKSITRELMSNPIVINIATMYEG